MKGQMFLILAVVIASSILVIKATMHLPETYERMKVLKTTLEKEILDNIGRELKNSARFSADEKENITTNVYDFANFTDRKMEERFFDFYFFFVGSLVQTNGVMNTSVLNFLEEKKNVTLNLNGTLKNSFVDRKGRWDTSFTITPGSTYVLTVSFSGYSENITVEAKENKDVYVGFFDYYLKSEEATHRNKEQETYVLG